MSSLNSFLSCSAFLLLCFYGSVPAESACPKEPFSPGLDWIDLLFCNMRTSQYNGNVAEDIAIYCTTKSSGKFTRVYLKDNTPLITTFLPVKYLLIPGVCEGIYKDQLVNNEWQPKGWLNITALTLAREKQETVCVFDWSILSWRNYQEIKSRTIYKASSYLKETMLAIGQSDLILVAHSIGGHMGGIAADGMNPKAKELVALDLAGVDYEGVPTIDRLDPADFLVSKCIITNPGGFGTTTNNCGANFWISQLSCSSAPKRNQPGCTDDKCSHRCALLYFYQLITKDWNALSCPQRQPEFVGFGYTGTTGEFMSSANDCHQIENI